MVVAGSAATVRAMKDRSQRLALDVQGFVRIVTPEGRLAYAAWPERERVLGMTDILKTDAVEAEFLTGTADIHEAARILQVKHLLDGKPRQLSCSQRQRVAIWRAIVRAPEVFLFY